MLQLGDVPVHRVKKEVWTQPDDIETVTLRVSAYKDEFPQPWDQFVQAPFKTIVKLVPQLRLCSDSACNGKCPLFHPAVEEASVDHVVLDVWSWRFYRSDGKKADTMESQLFQVFIRTPASAGPILQAASGFSGVYFDPRTADGRAVDSQYSIVWMPGVSGQEARHKFRTCDHGIALTRIGTKFGIRVLEAHEHTVFAFLRPGMAFVQLRMTAVFRLFPLPFGIQRGGVAQLLKGWGWKARPLQSCKGSSEGSAWEVGAETAPPQPILPGFDGEIIATKVRDIGPREHHNTPVCASGKTKKHILQGANASSSAVPSSTAQDPWLNGHDPWSQWHQSDSGDVDMSSVPCSTNAGSKKLVQLGDQLKQDMQLTVRQEIENSGDGTRLAMLESTVTELQEQGRRFESWFAEAGAVATKQGEDIHQLRQVVTQQQQDMSDMKGQLSSQTEAVQGSIMAVKIDLAQQLDSQFQRFEALLSKKARTE